MILRLIAAAIGLAFLLPRIVPAGAAPDGTPPMIVSARMVDSDNDQRADRIVLTYSERVSTKGHPRPGPFRAPPYYITSVQPATRSFRVTLVVVERSKPDPAAKPAVEYSALKCGGGPVTDAAGNEADSQVFRGTRPLAGDGAAASAPARSPRPRITRAQMKDVDGDRKADRIVVTYNRSIDFEGEAARSKLFSIEGYRVTAVRRAVASRTLTLVLAEKAKPDTAEAPHASYCAPPPSAPGPRVESAGPGGAPADTQFFDVRSVDDDDPKVPPVVRVRTKARLAVSVAGVLECSGAFIKVDGVRAAGDIVELGVRTCTAEFTGIKRGATVEISVLGAAPPTPAVGGCDVFNLSEVEDTLDGDTLTTGEITLTVAGFAECVL